MQANDGVRTPLRRESMRTFLLVKAVESHTRASLAASRCTLQIVGSIFPYLNAAVSTCQFGFRYERHLAAYTIDFIDTNCTQISRGAGGRGVVYVTAPKSQVRTAT